MTQPESDPPCPAGDAATRSSGGALIRGDASSVRRPVIVQSWQRCEAIGVIRDGSHLPPIELRADDLAEYREQHPLAAMLPICRELLGDVVREYGCVFALGDARGVLLWVEGDPRTCGRVERIHFVEGAVWAEDTAGTNAPGTALEVGAATQIRSVEHFNEAVRAWSCAASPIRDPDSGSLLGVLDVTGGDVAAEPQMLALVRATARAVEAELARQVALQDLRAHETYSGEHSSRKGAAALVSPGGRVLVASADLGLIRIAGVTETGDGVRHLPDGRRLLIEPVGVSGYVVVRLVDGPEKPHLLSPVRLSVLGRDTSLLEIDGRTVKLGPRHSEILVLLAFAGEGLTVVGLAEGLSRSRLNPTTLRVDMSRLRALIGEELLASRPYRLRRPVRTDAHVVEDLLAERRVEEACALYPGPLLPHSQAPGIVRRRERLHDRLRSAVLDSYDSTLLQRWLEAPWGADDAPAWRTLSGLIPEGSPRRAAALARAESLAVTRPSPPPGSGRGPTEPG